MRCIFCQKPVFGEEGTTLPGNGPSHRDCAEKASLMKRVYKGLDLATLTDEEIDDLLHFIEVEKNARSSCNEIELF